MLKRVSDFKYVHNLHKDGEHVVAGQEICIIEAMKMQNVLRSSRTGVIRRRAKLGASLVSNDLIVEFVSDK